jgi:hypothetical protein
MGEAATTTPCGRLCHGRGWALACKAGLPPVGFSLSSPIAEELDLVPHVLSGIVVHSVLVDVNLDLAHRQRSAPVLFFEGLCLPRLSFRSASISVWLAW